MTTMAQTPDNLRPRHEQLVVLALAGITAMRAAFTAETVTEKDWPMPVKDAITALGALGSDLEALGIRGPMPTFKATEDAVRSLTDRWFDVPRADRRELTRCLTDFSLAMIRTGMVTEGVTL